MIPDPADIGRCLEAENIEPLVAEAVDRVDAAKPRADHDHLAMLGVAVDHRIKHQIIPGSRLEREPQDKVPFRVGVLMRRDNADIARGCGQLDGRAVTIRP